jgi:hypothetical protein
MLKYGLLSQPYQTIAFNPAAGIGRRARIAAGLFASIAQAGASHP